MKIGDLVCYNGAGQKHQTIGLVLDVYSENLLGASYYSRNAVLIQWGCVGNGILPRTTHQDAIRNRSEIYPGDIVWHELGNWFEVIK